MTRFYLDTSIAFAALASVAPAMRWFDEATLAAEVLSSRLLQTELTRSLRRDGIPVRLRDAILDHVGIIPITEQVLSIAESITEHVRTLDSIHLATALHLGGGTVIISHDAMMLRVAEELGLHTLDPLG